MSLTTFVKRLKKQNTSNNQALRIFDIESNRQNSMLRIAIWRMFAIFVGDIDLRINTNIIYNEV